MQMYLTPLVRSSQTVPGTHDSPGAGPDPASAVAGMRHANVSIALATSSRIRRMVGPPSPANEAGSLSDIPTLGTTACLAVTRRCTGPHRPIHPLSTGVATRAD